MARTQKKHSKANGLQILVALLALAMLGIAFAGAALFLFLCMIPTYIALFIDRQFPRTLGLTVGAANLAGTVPNFLEVLKMNDHPANALSLALQPSTLAMAYAGAGIGWLIHLAVTRFVALVIVSKAEMRIQKLAKREQVLIERWGPEIKQQYGGVGDTDN
ncbi:MAG: hypothetical protein EP349_09760 [Alphaproteobacteria bacterium]|nr:MAG: hypothetical protein EP349_09760 [Alphaproteobacteria bacterium]